MVSFFVTQPLCAFPHRVASLVSCLHYAPHLYDLWPGYYSQCCPTKGQPLLSLLIGIFVGLLIIHVSIFFFKYFIILNSENLIWLNYFIGLYFYKKNKSIFLFVSIWSLF